MRRLIRSRAPGVNRFGRSGLESPRFHTGPVATKAAAIQASAQRARANLRRASSCPRCDHRLSAGRCPSCRYDPRDFDDRDNPGYVDDSGLLGDDLNRRGRFD